MEIGKIIKEERKRKGMTQAELGGLVGISHTTIARYESGKVVPPLKVIERLSNALNIKIIEPESVYNHSVFEILCKRLGYDVESVKVNKNNIFTNYIHVYDNEKSYMIKSVDAQRLIDIFAEQTKLSLEGLNNGKAEETHD